MYCAGLLVSSIRLTRTSLPSHAILGEDVVLECSYDMEGDKLYSVKWYRWEITYTLPVQCLYSANQFCTPVLYFVEFRNGKEFYRHIPSDRPPTAVFSQPGLIVDVSWSSISALLCLVSWSQISPLVWVACTYDLLFGCKLIMDLYLKVFYVRSGAQFISVVSYKITWISLLTASLSNFQLVTIVPHSRYQDGRSCPVLWVMFQVITHLK